MVIHNLITGRLILMAGCLRYAEWFGKGAWPVPVALIAGNGNH